MSRNEQLIIDGHATYKELGLVLIGTPTETPPTLNTYMVDVPGGAQIDLTDYSGAPTFSKREQSFTLLLSARAQVDVLKELTHLASLFHGRRLDYELSWDPGYTYHGRWQMSDFEDGLDYGIVTLSVVADPWKSAGIQTWRVNAAGGVMLTLPCGRKRVCPTIEVNREALVTYDDLTWTLEPGASKIRSLWISAGDNEVCINTAPDYGAAKWSDISGTWTALRNKRLAEIAAGSSPIQAPDAWSAHSAQAWLEFSTKRWVELAHEAGTDDEYAAYIQFEIEEL